MAAQAEEPISAHIELRRIGPRLICRSTWPLQSERRPPRRRSKNGPRGALLLSAVAVGLLFIGWLAFYFLLFRPRGPIG